jgi:hypothetical protein
VLIASVKKPLSMLATPEAITIVSEGPFIDIINLPNLSVQGTSKSGTPLTHAYAYNSKLVCLSRSEEGWAAEPILLPSGLMSGLVHADAIVICPENSEGLYAGEEVWAELLA